MRDDTVLVVWIWVAITAARARPWHLETRCRAREAIALIERAAVERGIPPRTLTLGTDNGSAFTARAFKAVLAVVGQGWSSC